MTPLLALEAVTYTYGRGRGGGAAREGVVELSASIGRGECVGVLGPSGSGKSTLARLAAGLIFPQAGRVFFDGVRLAPPVSLALRRRLQLVLQDAGAALDPRCSVLDALCEPLEVQGLGTPVERRERVVGLVEAVGLSHDVLDRLPRALSSGQRQRIVLARALALEPELLVLDEPTSAVDLSTQALLLNLLMELRRSRGLAMLLISHDEDVVRLIAERTLRMEAGRLQERSFEGRAPC